MAAGATQPRGKLPPGLAIREVEAADCPVLCEIYNETVRARLMTFDLTEKTPDFFERLLANQQADEPFIVLESLAGPAHGPSTKVLGYARLWHYSDREGYRRTAETQVYLWLSLARRGYGSILKRAIIDCARQLGYHHLHAKICVENTASIEYNRRFGYETVGIQREIGWVDGQWRDVLVMQLILQMRASATRPRAADTPFRRQGIAHRSAKPPRLFVITSDSAC